MRPETTPLMYARAIDAGWFLGKQICYDYRWAEKDQREKSATLIHALVDYFDTPQNHFGEDLFQILGCAERHVIVADGKGDVITYPEPQKAPAEAKY